MKPGPSQPAPLPQTAGGENKVVGQHFQPTPIVLTITNQACCIRER